MGSFHELIAGFHNFQESYLLKEKEFFDQLAHGQEPKSLVIACCDSRVDPAILLGGKPGDLFVVRSIAALIPPVGLSSPRDAVMSALEYGVKHLDVDHLIVMGHSACGGIHAALFTQVFEGKIDPALLAGILTALKIKGETPEEIEGAARAMVAAAAHFPRPRGVEVGEIVGTGGDGMKTINVSTTTALLAAAAGLKIAKHGNRGVSSPTGASDLLTALGVDIRLTPDESAQLLDATGFCFCFAQLYHPAMRFAGPVRAALKTRTIFNILGPLTNPAHPDYALIGVYSPDLLETVAQTLRLLGVKRAYVVHGSGLDEAAVHGTTEIAELKEDGTIERSTLTPADLGAKRLYSIEEIKGGAPADNALITEAILAGKGTEAQQAFVTANLALLLKIGGLAKSLPEAVELARRTMASGKGLEVLNAHRAYAASHTASSQKAA